MKILKLEKSETRILITIEEQKSWLVRLFTKEPTYTYQVFVPVKHGCWSAINLCHFPSGKRLDLTAAFRIQNLIIIKEIEIEQLNVVEQIDQELAKKTPKQE